VNDVIDLQNGDIAKKQDNVVIETQGIKYISPEYAENTIKDIQNQRNRVLFLFLLDTGVRVGEATQVKKRDLDFDEGFVNVKTLKKEKQKSRKIPLSKRLQNILPFYVGDMNLDDRLFSISTQRVRQLVDEYFPTRVSPHTFRHTFSYRYMRGGGDLYDLSRILGHSHITSTEVYADISPKDLKDKFEEVIEQ